MITKIAPKTTQKRLNFTFCSTSRLSPRQNPMPSNSSFPAPETCQAHFLHLPPEIPRLFFNLQVEPLRTWQVAPVPYAALRVSQFTTEVLQRVSKTHCVSGHDFSRAEKAINRRALAPAGPKPTSAKLSLKHALKRPESGPSISGRAARAASRSSAQPRMPRPRQSGP